MADDEKDLTAGLQIRCGDVFNFEHVKKKAPAPSKEEEEEKEKKEEPELKEEEREAARAEEKEEVKERKGQESLFRVPDADFKMAGRKRPRALYEPPKRERANPGTASGRREEFGRRGGKGRGGRTPGFKADPSKYTKYSLKDVDLLNNRSNTAAAFDFLREVKERDGGPVEERFEVDSGQKIVFKKKSKEEGPSKEEAATSDQGEAPPKKKEKKKEKKSPAMSLSHLMDEEEEED